MCFAPQWRALFRHLNLQKWREHVVFCTFWLRNVRRATTACTFSTSELPKVVREWCVLYILTWKCASRHNGVHFFDISTSKSGPKLVCFVHFDLEICFAPQRRALFWHRNFQKWSGPGVFCTFWLQNVLRATTACTFLTSQLPKVVRSWCVLYVLTSKCASRHNGVQLFISHLASWLRTRRFSEPTFRPSGAPNHWKNRVFRDFPTFSRISIFFLLTLSLLLFFLLIFLFSLPLPCSAFHLSLLSEVWLLNFLRSYQLRQHIFLLRIIIATPIKLGVIKRTHACVSKQLGYLHIYIYMYVDNPPKTNLIDSHPVMASSQTPRLLVTNSSPPKVRAQLPVRFRRAIIGKLKKKNRTHSVNSKEFTDLIWFDMIWYDLMRP